MAYVDPTALALCIVFPFLSMVAVVARFRARSVQKVKLGADDWVIIPALVRIASKNQLVALTEGIWIFSLGNAANIMYGAVKADLGQHIPLDHKGFAVNGPKLVALEKMTYITPILAGTAIGCARWSVLLLYYRIFDISRNFRYAVFFMMGLNIGWIITFVFVFVFRCTPIKQVWESQQGERKHCIGIQSNYAYAVSSVVLDIMVLSMPWPMIWKLHMAFRQKIAVTAIFMLGAIVTAAGIGKCVAFYTVGGVIAKNHDLTYDEAPLFYWTVPECSLAVVCACLPTLRPVFHGITPTSLVNSMRSLFSITSVGSKNNSNNATFADHPWRVVGEDGHADRSMAEIARVNTEANSAQSSYTKVGLYELGKVHSGFRQSQVV